MERVYSAFLRTKAGEFPLIVNNTIGGEVTSYDWGNVDDTPSVLSGEMVLSLLSEQERDPRIVFKRSYANVK